MKSKSVQERAEAVVSRILTENILSLSQARNELDKVTGYRPDKATLCRWITRGVGGVKLEAVRLGGRNIYTSTEALNRFIVARTAGLQ
jgi:hypothetical protein